MSLKSNVLAVVGKITEAADILCSKVDELGKLDQDDLDAAAVLVTEIQQQAATIKSFSADLKTLL